MDVSATLVSNSTQLDNVDLMGGPRVFTIAGVTLHDGDQPLHIALAEYGRPWKPGVTMRRLLSEMWGAESDAWVGRRVRLYRDEAVTFGRDKTGGTRISHASHLEKPIAVTLPTSKGKFGEFKVAPLVESAAPPAGDFASDPITPAQIKALNTAASELGLTREQKIGGISQTIGRLVESSKDLTKDEATKVIKSLNLSIAQRPVLPQSGADVDPNGASA